MEKYKRIYYKEDPFFVFELEKNIATFKAIRGLTPKIYANIPGRIYLFFIPEGSHTIEVRDWTVFKGEEIRIKQRYLRRLEEENIRYSRVFRLNKIKDSSAIVVDTVLNNEIEVPLSEVYIPASTRLLRNFGVFDDLYAFTSFKEAKEMTEFRFLERALQVLLPNSREFTVRIGLTDTVFRRVLFRIGERI